MTDASGASSRPGADRDGDDTELYQLLRGAGFQGPVWEKVSTEMIRYAIEVCRPMIGSGRIFELCGKRGWILRRIPRALTGDEEEFLTVEVVGKGILSFQKALKQEK